MKPKIKLFKSKIIKDDNQRKKENWYISKIRLNINKKVNASIYKCINLYYQKLHIKNLHIKNIICDAVMILLIFIFSF